MANKENSRDEMPDILWWLFAISIVGIIVKVAFFS